MEARLGLALSLVAYVALAVVDCARRIDTDRGVGEVARVGIIILVIIIFIVVVYKSTAQTVGARFTAGRAREDAWCARCRSTGEIGWVVDFVGVGSGRINTAWCTGRV